MTSIPHGPPIRGAALRACRATPEALAAEQAMEAWANAHSAGQHLEAFDTVDAARDRRIAEAWSIARGLSVYASTVNDRAAGRRIAELLAQATGDDAAADAHEDRAHAHVTEAVTIGRGVNASLEALRTAAAREGRAA